jgi:cell division protein FtsZ
MSPKNLFESKAIIKVIGVGGAGCNAVNRMIEAGVSGVEFIAMNTDRQALETSLADITLPLGVLTTRGLGTGGDPVKGEASARESEKAIQEVLEGADMVFIAAGMGGGTGTGGAPVVAEIARRHDILTIGVVSKPFIFEGPKRKRLANEGAERLKKSVDTLIVIPNDKLMSVVEKKTSLSESFNMADDVLRHGVQGISDIIVQPGLINVDFADVKSVMQNAGVALMGMGVGVGEQRARVAAEAAANSPMLETSIQGAKKILVNFTAGADFTIGEAHEAMEYIMHLADAEEAEIFLGHVLNENIGEQVMVTLLAAGMDSPRRREEDREVFVQPFEAPRPAATQAAATAPVAEPVAAGSRRRGVGEPMSLNEIDFDIPAFLRRQRSGN